ncbi:DMT family transporter [Pseudoruegeria sp. HB172150]|uniref:DMT family transporter n=1 Tax=Pseudoruegeria sp. HB172150 TaxID=2721164 RepID=UPI0015577D7B|nr:DMT family transporter [Pseudoruegeria sp. HB172150]
MSRQDHAPLLGAALMMVVSGMMAVDSIIVRYLSPDVHPFIMGFTRASFGLLVVLPWILRRRGMLKSNYRFLHFVRAALKLASLILFFIAFASAPLAEVTAIAFTSPIFVTLGAWLFLSERPNAARVAAVLLGFAGVLIVLRPGQSEEVPSGLVFAIAGAVLTAVIQLILKDMSSKDRTETLVAWNLILTAPIAAIPALFVWSNPTPTEWALLALQGVMGAFNMMLATKAFSLAEASLIAPFDFLRLPFVALLGYLIFAQSVPLSTWIGGSVIFAASLLMARSARRRVMSQT